MGQGVGNYVSYEKKGSNLTVHGTKGDLLITVFTPDIYKVQVLQSPGSGYLDSSYSVNLKPSYVIDQVIETSSNIQLLFEKSTLEISKVPLQVALKKGNEVKIKSDNSYRQTKDSLFLSFDINPQDVFHGAGGRPFGMDLNRKAFEFYNTWEFAYYEEATGLSQSFNVPFIVSSHKYGILFDSDLPGFMRMYVGSLDSTKLQINAFSSGKWAYYLVNGESNDQILENYTLLTGRQPLPPRWALGYLQSKFGYKTESEARSVVSTTKSQGFPLDALVLDLYWYGDETKMGNFSWESSNWPTPTQMMSDFAKSGVKTILITDPYITTKSFNFSSAETQRLFATKPASTETYTQNIWNGTVGLLDIFKPATQDWLGQKYKTLTNQGVSGWWCDKVEPDYHPFDANHVLGNGRQVHNLYSLFWAKKLFENFQKDFPEKRLFNLTRSGWAGSQRYSALPWSGDVARYWAGLKLQIPIMVQAGMSGLAYMHSDIGGFATMSDKKEKDEELDLRWFQFGTFTPIVRAHGARTYTEPYNLAEPFFSIVKKYLNIRYQMLPYVYSLAWKNTTTGRPICLPMDYFDPNKMNGDIKDQYLFGENMLVAPAFLPGMPSRKVVLPKGNWFDFWTNEFFAGGTNIFPAVTVNHIPVYAKAGSFIPLSGSKFIGSTDAYTSDSLTVKFYQDISVANSSFTMFHDDGYNPKSIANQQYELIDFKGHVTADSVQIETSRRINYNKGLASRAMQYEMINITSSPLSVKLNGKDLPVVYIPDAFKSEMAYYDVLAKKLSIRYQWDCNVKSVLSVLRDGLSIVTGIEEPAEKELLNVFPNPVLSGSVMTVKANITGGGNYNLKIFSQSGIVVKSQPIGKKTKGDKLDLSLDIRDLHGAFVVKLQNENGSSITKKIIIQ